MFLPIFFDASHVEVKNFVQVCLMLRTDTIVALATPQGIGAIAVIRLSGAEAIAIANAVFRGKDLRTQPSHTVHYGYLTDGDTLLDEVMVALFRAPKSFTTEDVVEISCHGSPFIAEQIIHLLIKTGARSAKPGEFTQRAFLHGRIDLTQAEAVADIIAADSTAARDVALKQMRGGFTHELQQLRQQLIDYTALIELELDFGEEDVAFANRDHLLQLIGDVEDKITPLLHSFSIGNVIKHGVNTVILGRPNAGKSTLLNALLNEERAIVSDIPGTTRDTIEETMHVEGILFRFIDTAGIRHTEDVIEQKGVARALEKLQQSAVYIYLFDVNTLTPQELLQDIEELNLLQFKGIICGNKIDKANWKVTSPFRRMFEWKYPELDSKQLLLYLSSHTHFHLPELRRKLYGLVARSADRNPSAEIVTNVRHYEALLRANEALHRAKEGLTEQRSGELIAFDLREALDHLGSITGEVGSEEILGSIFSRFCIGK